MASCSTGDAIYGGAFGGLAKFLDGGIEGMLNDIASAIMKAAVSLFADLAGKIPSFPTNSSGKYDASLLGDIGLQINWLVVAIAVASILVAAARMALERRGQAGTTALKGMLKVILVSSGFSYVIIKLAELADHYSTHLYKAGLEEQLKTIASCGTDSLTAFLLIIIGLLLILAGIIHILLLYIRLGLMVLLAGTLPLAAAASMTEWGGSWWKRHIAWMVAWLAFKPATGLVMYSGAVMLNSQAGAEAVHMKIAGCGVLLLSAVALPALLRLVVPALSELGSSNPTGAMAGAAAGGAAKATGAVASGALGYASRGSSGGGGGGSRSGGGASGAASTGGGSGGGGGGGGGGPSGGGGSGRSVGRTLVSGAARGAAGVAGVAAWGAAAVGSAAAQHGVNAVSSALPGQGDSQQR
ncbi:hypothetical protein [Jidongwangia harbinensis]|uniref:hypothetical protein n=1 Tax=Jidongwangia harbinensis TaxID=2878561 RepID=UPI001CD99102|nr:hypothetical protein [Jidongwangia harbinensis]MCA2211839.1 hypothetical protein [Jidongwangia harbinensis]